MFLKIAFLFSLSTTVNAVICGALGGVISECSNHTMIAIDASNYLQDEGLAAKIIDFVSNSLMHKWSYNSKMPTQFSFALYGVVNRTDLTCKGFNTRGQSDPEIVCSSLENLKGALARRLLAPASLQEITADIQDCTIRSENRYYASVILFTANNNPADIKASANFTKNFPVFVVNLANGDFSSWISASSQPSAILCNGNHLDDDLAYRIISASCGNITGSEQCNLVPTTALPPVSVPVTGMPPNDGLCDCDITQSWNDVMILLDSSSIMGPDRFHELEAFVQSAFTRATIGSEKQNTRVGVITYGSSATLIASLDHYNNTNSFVHDQWPFFNQPDTNILAALDLAMKEFGSSGHRAASRKVVILGASTYRQGSYDSPLEAAKTFKRNFGVIIVIGYGDIHGLGLEVLIDLSSPGFFINATLGIVPDFNDLVRMICNANCFCPGQQYNQKDSYFPVAKDGEIWPSRACYWDSTLTSIQALVNRTCLTIAAAPGIPAMPDTIAKQQGILSGATLNPTTPALYIGLQKQLNGQWMWYNGNPYDGGNILGTGNCATVRKGSGFNPVISAVDCDGSYLYACQHDPCTTRNFCG